MENTALRTDPHSFAKPSLARVTHMAMDLRLDMEKRIFSGHVRLDIEGPSREVILDTSKLDISKVTDKSGKALEWSLGAEDAILGRPLTVKRGEWDRSIFVYYCNRPEAGGLQWLTKEMALSKKPFMFSQGQTILTRGWLPCQDTPMVRSSWSARIVSTSDQTILMSGLAVQSGEFDDREDKPSETVVYYTSAQDVPSYLIAIAAGDLVFRPVGKRTGVWALPDVADEAAEEFSDMENMIRAAEKLYGKYDWGRFDVLVLPASFPFGGMENPCLTFVTPTLIAGDKSLVSVVVHELAHAWSGNKVTNDTWADTWLNEGLTMYAEHRLMEELYGVDIADLHRAVDGLTLAENIEELKNGPDTKLVVDLLGRDPDDAFTYIPYYKGVALWRWLEQIIGREKFDEYLIEYIDTFAWQSISHYDWLGFWRERLTQGQWQELRANKWLFEVGTPTEVPTEISFPKSRLLDEAVAVAGQMIGDPEQLVQSGVTDKWHTHQWRAVVEALPKNIGAEKFANIDRAFKMSKSTNTEIRWAWSTKALAGGDKTAWDGAEELVSRVGRMRVVKSVYQAMYEMDPDRASKVYWRNRSNYHNLLTRVLDTLIKPTELVAKRKAIQV